MRMLFLAAWLFCVTGFQIAYCQSQPIDRAAFFKDTSLMKVTLVTNLVKILNHNNKKGYNLTGTFIATLPDGTKVNDTVLIEKRGHFRSDFCYVPPIKIIFNYKDSARLNSLKSMKLVSECKVSYDHEQCLFQEYMVYRIYNLIGDRSFQVKLLNIKWEDSGARKNPLNEYGFLLEDLKDLAYRHNCMVWQQSTR